MREVVVNRLYRHFKGNFYYVKDVAQHTESGEMMVVYQAMYGEYGTFVRPVDMFLEEIDPVERIMLLDRSIDLSFIMGS